VSSITLSSRNRTPSPWLEAGLAAGYFDQPQMARDFQRYLGCTATAWARDQVELARSLASQTYKPSPHSPL
jgi:AraC-like DNA-binding protein